LCSAGPRGSRRPADACAPPDNLFAQLTGNDDPGA
jgi:hypothetical protein